MLLAIIDFDTTPADHATALEQLSSEAPAVRAIDGNQRFTVHSDGSTTVTVIHEWDTRASFDAYLASDAFARFGDKVLPLMTSPPISRRFEAELLEAV